jgi:hypothetical protein
MELIEKDAMMMLTTSVTAPGRMLSMLADAPVSGGHMGPLLAVLLEVCSLQRSFA